MVLSLQEGTRKFYKGIKIKALEKIYWEGQPVSQFPLPGKGFSQTQEELKKPKFLIRKFGIPTSGGEAGYLLKSQPQTSS